MKLTLPFAFFFAFSLALYGGAHWWLWARTRACLPAGWGQWLLAAGFGVLALAPLAAALLEHWRLDRIGQPLAWIGWAWMGLLLFWFSAWGVLALARFAARLAGQPWPWSASATWAVAFAAALLLSAYTVYEARQLRVQRLEIRTPKIPASAGTIRIAQISDVHVGLLVRHRRLGQIVRTLERIQPDILLSTGDLLDAQVDGCEGVCGDFQTFTPRLGKFAITGNHEFYPGLEQTLAFTREAGFEILRGEIRTLAGVLTLVGIDDKTGDYFGNRVQKDEPELLAQVPAGTFTLLLKHQPKVHPEALGRFDLMLSGHTHGGQIFPFHLFTKLAFPLHAGYYPLAKGSAAYVSRGTGSWGPPMRLFAPAEITLIELIPAGQ